MALTQTETLGLADKLVAGLKENQAALIARGFDPTLLIGQVATLKAAAEKHDAEQEAMKTALLKKTEVTTQAHDELYRTVSGGVNAAAGMLDHTSPAGESFLKMRAAVRIEAAAEKASAPSAGPVVG